MKLHADAGKKPAHVKKDVPGFIGNRLQHALWREAIALVEQGICDAETVDNVIKAAFGRRLAVLGPLENADMVGTDLTLAIHKTVLPDIDSRPRPRLISKSWCRMESSASNRVKASANGLRNSRRRYVRRCCSISKKHASRMPDSATGGEDHDATCPGGFPAARWSSGARRHRDSRRCCARSRRKRSRRSSGLVMSARRPARSPGFGEADAFILEQVRGILGQRLAAAAARLTRWRSSPRTANRAAAAQQKWRPN